MHHVLLRENSVAAGATRTVQAVFKSIRVDEAGQQTEIKPIREGATNFTGMTARIKPDRDAAIRLFLLILNPSALFSARMSQSEGISIAS